MAAVAAIKITGMSVRKPTLPAPLVEAKKTTKYLVLTITYGHYVVFSPNCHGLAFYQNARPYTSLQKSLTALFGEHKMQIRRIAAAIGLGFLATISLAEDSRVVSSASLKHSSFQLLPEATGTTLRHASLPPPAPLSTSGFDMGYGISASRLLQPPAYRLTTRSDALHASGMQIQRSLPFGFGVGASFGAVPGSEASMIGAEARYALIPDSMVLPTIGLRASYGTLQGSDWLNVNTRGIDLSLSKGFSLVTPYAGFGSVWVDSDAYEGAGLAREHFQHDKYFIGATFNLRLMNFAVEADRTGDTTNYHAKFGWRW